MAKDALLPCPTCPVTTVPIFRISPSCSSGSPSQPRTVPVSTCGHTVHTQHQHCTAHHLQLVLFLPSGAGRLCRHLLVEADAALRVALVYVVILEVLLHLLDCARQPLQLPERTGQP
jgi:hypothetical protein